MAPYIGYELVKVDDGIIEYRTDFYALQIEKVQGKNIWNFVDPVDASKDTRLVPDQVYKVKEQQWRQLGPQYEPMQKEFPFTYNSNPGQEDNVTLRLWWHTLYFKVKHDNLLFSCNRDMDDDMAITYKWKTTFQIREPLKYREGSIESLGYWTGVVHEDNRPTDQYGRVIGVKDQLGRDVYKQRF